MNNLFIKETYVNATENYIIGDSDGYFESFTADKGELYRDLVSEYGRCTGKVYVDLPEGKAKEVGWVFIKRMKYEDANETYLREVWVTIQEPENLRHCPNCHALITR